MPLISAKRAVLSIMINLLTVLLHKSIVIEFHSQNLGAAQCSEFTLQLLGRLIPIKTDHHIRTK